MCNRTMEAVRQLKRATIAMKKLVRLFTNQEPVHFYDHRYDVNMRMILLCPGKEGENVLSYMNRVTEQCSLMLEKSWDTLPSPLLTPMLSMGYQWIGTFHNHDFFFHWCYGRDVMWTIKSEEHVPGRAPETLKHVEARNRKRDGIFRLTSTTVCHVKAADWESAINL